MTGDGARLPESLRTVIEQLHAAIGRAADGDPRAIQALYSQSGDVTAFYGWGGYERGWEAVRERWNWAAAQFGGGTVAYQNLTTVATAEMAYTTDVETFRVRLAGRPWACGANQKRAGNHEIEAGVDGVVEWSNRVTHIFRLEDGAWRLVHRHANRLEAQRRPTRGQR